MSHDHSMRVRRVDLVASFLASATIVASTLVLLLAVLWLLQEQTPLRPGDLIARTGGAEAPITPIGREIGEPAEEVLASEAFEDELSSLQAAVTEVAEQVHAMDTGSRDGRTQSIDTGLLEGPGDVSEGGSEDGAGNGSGEQSGLPAHERWEITFEAKDKLDYARQLDHFGIELGCIGGGIPTIDYVAKLSGPLQSRSGPSSAESRLYFAWKSPNVLSGYDRELLQAAAIPTAKRLSLRFIPRKLEDELLRLELSCAAAAGRELAEVKRTVFRSQATARAYEFAVVQQTYRDKGRP
ncbi:MAG: hypothetical protein R3C53_20650 [Pirellulaceae bacterium]